MECTNPNGCTLDHDEMLERIRAWQQVAAQAISRSIQVDRITSVYPPDAQLLQRLKDLVAAEAICCSFLEFNVQEEEDQTVVELSFPEEARALVESVMGLRRVGDP